MSSPISLPPYPEDAGDTNYPVHFPIETLRRVLELSSLYPAVQLTAITGENKTRTDAKRAAAFIEAKLWPKHHTAKKLSLSWLKKVISLNSGNNDNKDSGVDRAVSSSSKHTPVKRRVSALEKRSASPASSLSPSSSTVSSLATVNGSQPRKRKSAQGTPIQGKKSSHLALTPAHEASASLSLLPPKASSSPLSTTIPSTHALVASVPDDTKQSSTTMSQSVATSSQRASFSSSTATTPSQEDTTPVSPRNGTLAPTESSHTQLPHPHSTHVEDDASGRAKRRRTEQDSGSDHAGNSNDCHEGSHGDEYNVMQIDAPMIIDRQIRLQQNQEARALADRVYDLAVKWQTELADQRRTLADKWTAMEAERVKMEMMKAEMERKIDDADKAKARLLAAVNTMDVMVTEEKKKEWLESPEARERFQEQLDAVQHKVTSRLNEELAQKDSMIAALTSDKEQAQTDMVQKLSTITGRFDAERVELQNIINRKEKVIESHVKSIESLQRELRVVTKTLADVTAKTMEQTKQQMELPHAKEKRSSPALDMLLTAAS